MNSNTPALNTRATVLMSILSTFCLGSATILVLVFLTAVAGAVAAPTVVEDSASEFIEFDDRPLDQDIILPDWFKLSFLELNNDLVEAVEEKKRGIILYFGQKDCPYCKVHLEKNWSDRGIVTYTQKHFDVIAIDVRGDRPVVSIKGNRYNSEKEFAAKLKTDFTPSFLFLDEKGREALRLTGYHPPYQFRAALEYVADDHYKTESLRSFLARGSNIPSYEETELNRHAVFSKPPYALDRSKIPGSAPLVVFFEQPTCHACNVLHAGPLKDKQIVKKLNQFEVVQLDMLSDTPVLNVEGQKTTAKKWAAKLGLYYAPTLVFFDELGSEILRVDSVIRFYRLGGVLDYVASKGYREHATFQLWRQFHNR